MSKLTDKNPAVGQDGIPRPIGNRPVGGFGIIYGPIANRPRIDNPPHKNNGLKT
jgi:hypothetical protein